MLARERRLTAIVRWWRGTPERGRDEGRGRKSLGWYGLESRPRQGSSGGDWTSRTRRGERITRNVLYLDHHLGGITGEHLEKSEVGLTVDGGCRWDRGSLVFLPNLGVACRRVAEGAGTCLGVNGAIE